MAPSLSVRAVTAAALALLLVSPPPALPEMKKTKKPAEGLQESAVQEPTEKVVVMKDEEDRYEVVATLGELTVHHVFRGRSRVTIHDAFFASYPRVFHQEIYNVPLAEVKKNSGRFLRGFDGTLETKMLSAVYRELNPLFENRTVRRLPTPDERVISGIWLVGDDFPQRIYAEIAGGRRVPLTDALLLKIIRSEPTFATTMPDEEEAQ